MTGVGQQLQTMRRKSGLTQKVLAERLGVNRRTVIFWENEKTAIPLTRFLAFCEETGADAVRTIAALKMQHRKGRNDPSGH